MITLEQTSATVDLIIIGAGPSGMAAAIQSAQVGLSVLVVDENATSGGQIYRAVAQSPVEKNILGPDYTDGETLVRQFEAANIARLASATAWMIEKSERPQYFKVGISQYSPSGEYVSRVLTTRCVLIAAGALERPFPIEGWTLPGVITAGAAQTLLKGSGIVPNGPTVLAGTGPLLYLLAAQYVRAGVPIEAVLDTTPKYNIRRAFWHMPVFLLSKYARKGIGLISSVRRHTRIFTKVIALSAWGRESLEVVRFEAHGQKREIPARSLLLHQGVVPQVNLAMAAGCAHSWNRERLAFEPELGPFGESSVPGIYIAGDARGIGGAEVAEASGHVTALGIASYLGKLPIVERDARTRPLRRKLSYAFRGRRFIDCMFRPADHFRIPPDDTIVCRCEELTAKSVREATQSGAQGPNQLKALLRTGMGPCQGRLCGLTICEIMADALDRSPEVIGHYRIRNPVKPITVGSLANAIISPTDNP